MAHSAVEMLAENYKTMFALDNARNILLDLAKEYLQGEKTNFKIFRNIILLYLQNILFLEYKLTFRILCAKIRILFDGGDPFG